MVNRVAKPSARWIGAFLILIGILGYLDVPGVGRHGVVEVDSTMSLFHGCVGLILVALSFGGETLCAFSLYMVGGLFVTLAGYVLYQLGSYNSLKLFDLTFATRSAAYLQIALGLTAAVLGKMNTARQQLFRE